MLKYCSKCEELKFINDGFCTGCQQYLHYGTSLEFCDEDGDESTYTPDDDYDPGFLNDWGDS